MRVPSRFAYGIITLLGLQLFAATVFGGENVNADPLAGQPAIRHRRELRTGRFEIGPSVGFTLDRSFRQAFLGGIKLAYNITDYLSVGAEISGGISYDSALMREISDGYQESDRDDLGLLKQRLSDIKMAADVRATFTPFSGKIGIFSVLFMSYDLYVFGGFGMAILGNDFSDNTPEDDVDATNEGFKPGMAFGIGTRFFINRFVAIGLEVKDLLFSDNETGQDITRGLTATEQEAGARPLVDGDDASFSNHFIFSLNATFFLPTSAEISD